VAEQKTERAPTDRTVLQEFGLADLYEKAMDATNLTDFLDKLGVPLDENASVYLERGTGTGSKVKAVESVAGDQEGTFRAPPTSSWQGAVRQEEEVIPESRRYRRHHVE
jgi:hypothetical protein